jgi:D-alanyl-D-alanine carboxypeptidase
MPSQQEVLRAVTRLRAQGMTEGVIMNRLLLCGWPQKMVLDALTENLKNEREATRRSARRTKTFSFSTAAVSIAALVLLGGGAWTFANYNSPVSYSLTLPESTSSEGGKTVLTYGAWPALANPDFYASVTKSLETQNASFITADLTAMELRLYKDGELALTVPIVAKGKVGSWFETPVGIYEIQSREEKHKSSFSGTFLPWSLAFQGNFFIHGIPFYADGKEVGGDYSGGCIRLSTSDAEKVYSLASVGMPVIVYKTHASGDSFVYQPKGPKLSATSSLMVDITNGAVLSSQNEHARVPIASITKLMTALVAVEYLNLENTTIVPASAQVGTTIPRLRPGARENIRDLLILMLTESSNEAAEALAGALGRERFIELMNDKAAAIGLFETEFGDPSGLSEKNISTARDLFLLLQYIYENRRFIFDITTDSLDEEFLKDLGFSGLQNFNVMTGVKDDLLGGKIGNTDEAKQTYAGVFKLKVSGEERAVGVIVLGSQDVKNDTKNLINFFNKLYVDGIR